MELATGAEGAFDLIEIADAKAQSLAVIAPGRGGMVTRFRVGGREIFYLDEATFRDPSANVRGGNPVLFPSPGKLAKDAWAWGGRRGSMKQHGFARNLPWEVLTRSEDRVALRLRSSDATRAVYPWDFRAEYTYSVEGAALSIAMRFTNEGDSPMPFGAGFHPYFRVPEAAKAGTRVETGATRAFDNVQKSEVAFEGFDLTAPEVDMHLLDHGGSEAALEIEGEAPARIQLTGSPELGVWVVWAQKGKDFVCLEPWTCRGDALNTGEGLLVLAPGEERSLWLEIRVE